MRPCLRPTSAGRTQAQWTTIWRLATTEKPPAMRPEERPASESEKVKELVERLKAGRHPEAIQGQRMYRPWGYFETVAEGDRYLVRRLVLRPGGRQSLQKHFHRAEHLIVMHGTAEVTLDGAIHLVHENESVDLPIGSHHRLANPGRIDLELIEVQTGELSGRGRHPPHRGL